MPQPLGTHDQVTSYLVNESVQVLKSLRDLLPVGLRLHDPAQCPFFIEHAFAVLNDKRLEL